MKYTTHPLLVPLHLSHGFFFLIVFPYLASLGLPYSMWDLVPQSGIEPRPLHGEQGVLAPGPPGKAPRGFFKTIRTWEGTGWM